MNERRVRLALNGPSGEVLRIIAAQPYRASTNPLAEHAKGVIIPVARLGAKRVG